MSSRGVGEESMRLDPRHPSQIAFHEAYIRACYGHLDEANIQRMHTILSSVLSEQSEPIDYPTSSEGLRGTSPDILIAADFDNRVHSFRDPSGGGISSSGVEIRAIGQHVLSMEESADISHNPHTRIQELHGHQHKRQKTSATAV